MLFSEQLGFPCRIEVGDVLDYEIDTGNGKIVVQDAFFNRYPEPLSYLNVDALPDRVSIAAVSMAAEKDLPVIFGRSEISGNDRLLVCSIDIFSSTFFMLSRWEDCVSPERDAHNRLDTQGNLSVRHDFSLRPVINEYAALLASMLRQVGFDRKPKRSNSKLILTHDVDRLYAGPLARSLRECLRLRAPKRFLIDSYYRAARVDVLGTFHRIMDLSEAQGLQSRFYFIAGGKTDKEGYYDLTQPDISHLVREVRDRGHALGFHPSYDTYRDPEMWNLERETLQNALGADITEGRQHYLRFENPTTWQIWDDAGMEVDSTMGFADAVGFKCGTGDSFPIFDIHRRKQLALREQPLLAMDSALMKMEAPAASLSTLRKACDRYGMPVTLLFHNHSLDRTPWNRMQETYESLLADCGRGA
jgi:hypothetical protein